MKKTITLLLTLALLAGFTACGKETVSPVEIETEPTQTTSAEPQTERVTAQEETTEDEYAPDYGTSEITIPASLEALGYYDGIDSYALAGSSLTDITYKGTRAQWDKLVHAVRYPATLPGGVRVHCTDD